MDRSLGRHLSVLPVPTCLDRQFSRIAIVELEVKIRDRWARACQRAEPHQAGYRENPSPSLRIGSLKDKFQSKLDLPGRAHRAAHPSEIRIRERCLWYAECRCVEYVEAFYPKLRFQ